MANYDLTPRIAPNLDIHLIFPLLEFLQQRQLHPNEAILKTKIELLSLTNMIDYGMDIHKSLYSTDKVPQDMMQRRAEVVARLKSLEEGAAPVIAFLQNDENALNLQPQQIEALYEYAKFQFECGNYSAAADYLHHYRNLCTDSGRSVSALWGKLAAEILMQNWIVAFDELNRVKEVIESKSFSSPQMQVQNRIWLMHWSLFVFFNHENGRTQMIDLFGQDKYLNAIQTNAPHLLRYLAAAFVANKGRRTYQFRDRLVKVIQQEQHSYKDPITEFLACVFVDYDFDAAQEKMKECEQVLLNDPFLGKLREDFLENARLLMIENYCKIHQRVELGLLAQKLNMSSEEAERWIVNLIRNSKLDAKIDYEAGSLLMMEPNHVNVYEQLIDRCEGISDRTYKLVEQAQTA